MSVGINQKPVECFYCNYPFSNSEPTEVELRMCNICRNWTDIVTKVISKAVGDISLSKRITEIEYQIPVVGEYKKIEDKVDDLKISSIASEVADSKFVSKLNFSITVKKVDDTAKPIKCEINDRIIQSETPGQDYLESLLKDMLTLKNLSNASEEQLAKGLRLLALERK